LGVKPACDELRAHTPRLQGAAEQHDEDGDRLERKIASVNAPVSASVTGTWALPFCEPKVPIALVGA
jgi:hypothetical protein